MRSFIITLSVLAVLLVHAAALPAETLALKVGAVYPVTSDPIERDAVIVVRDGKIEEIGPAERVRIPPGARVVDRSNTWAFPGFVDLHNHIGGTDLNDMVYPTNPDLHVYDQIVPTPENEELQDALAGGVTTVLFIPGSGTNLSGFGALLKTYGRDVEDMVVRFPGAMKIAQAGNPERRFGDIGSSRMGMNWLIRDVLNEGLDLLRGLFRKDFPILVHTAWHVSTQASIRDLHDRFGLWVILSHATFDGFKNAPLVSGRGMHLNLGPRQFHMDYITGEVVGLGAEYWEGGVENLSINTDSPVVPQEELFLQATMSVRYGLPWDAAIRALTIVPARGIGIADRAGSLEPGKDADIVLWTGDPLDPRSHVELTLVEGEVAYDAAAGGRRF
jgi:imidazolonepropionase-like amidohydrolase